MCNFIFIPLCIANPGENIYPCFLSYGSSGSGNLSCLGVAALNATYPNGIGFFGYSSDIQADPTGIDTGEWHQVIFTYDGVNKKIYLDGEEADTYEYKNYELGTELEETFGLTIGKNTANANEYGEIFNGLVDEVGVWSKVLSVQEIADLYNSGSGQTMTGGSATVTIGESAGTGWTTTDLTIGAYGTVTSSGNSKINVAGAWDSSAGTFTKSTSTVTFNNAGSSDAKLKTPFSK